MGWRRALCTAPPKHDRSGSQILHSSDPPPARSPRLGRLSNFFTSSSNPSTPKLRCRTATTTTQSTYSLAPNNHISETESKTTPKSAQSSNPASPRSPLIGLFRNSFRSRNNCGVCNQRVKSGRGTAVYTAQCGHVFHFPCIATHVRGKQGKLACLVCNAEWNDEPLLAVHQNPSCSQPDEKWRNVEVEEKQVISTPKKTTPSSASSSPRPQFHHYQSRLAQVSSYNDDESLSSPRTPKVFYPIPEWEKEGEERSIFAHSGSMKVRSGSNGTDVEVRLMPEAALISCNSEHQTCAMVLRVKAPQLRQTAMNSRRAPLLDASRRAPIDLVTVLDVSGSMMGGKMQMMRRAMRLVISSLGPADRLSIVVFSAVPKRLLPLRRMTQSGQRAARNIIDRLECSQGSCVSDALRKATKVLEDRREKNPVATIILLSDGQGDPLLESQRQAPAPATQTAQQQSTTRFAHVEIPLNSPADDTFAKWVGGLLSVVMQDLRIVLGFPHGSPPAEITAVYCSDRQTSLLRSNFVSLGDLYAEEERELFVELRVPVSAINLEKTLTVRCSYTNPATHERVSTHQEHYTIPLASSSQAVQRLRNVFVSTRAVAESRRIILEHNEFTSAHRLLSSARALLLQSNSMSADECVQVLEAEIMELARRRQAQQMEEQERIMAAMRRQRAPEVAQPVTPPSMAGKKKSWNRVSDLHGFENARF